jgi:hypothetical protein
MSQELNDLELTSVIGGAKYSISSQKSNLLSGLGGGQKQEREEEEQDPLLSDQRDLVQ